MADTDFPSNIFDELDQEIDFENLEASKRVAVRYRRDDIQATLKIRKIFARSPFSVLLLDISSKGAAIQTTHLLNKNSKVRLSLHFKDGQVFDIDAIVARTEPPEYGLRFDRSHVELAEHLLDTQSELKFS